MRSPGGMISCRQEMDDAANLLTSARHQKPQSIGRVCLRVDVSYTDHSHMIGVSGKSSKYLSSKTNCHIHFPDCNKQIDSDKSNCVSISGHLPNAEHARSGIRMLQPLVFIIALPKCHPLQSFGTLRENKDVPLPWKHYLTFAENKYGVKVKPKAKSSNLQTSIFVKGSEEHSSSIQAATEMLVYELVVRHYPHEPGQVTNSLEVSAQHHRVVEGNVRLIMQKSGAVVLFHDLDDRNIPVHKKGSINISGPVRSVYMARQMLIGSLPVRMSFDLRLSSHHQSSAHASGDGDSGEDENQQQSMLFSQLMLHQLEMKHDVCVSMLQRGRDLHTVQLALTSMERNVGGLYRAYQELFTMHSELSVGSDTMPVLQTLAVIHPMYRFVNAPLLQGPHGLLALIAQSQRHQQHQQHQQYLQHVYRLATPQQHENNKKEDDSHGVLQYLFQRCDRNSVPNNDEHTSLNHCQKTLQRPAASVMNFNPQQKPKQQVSVCFESDLPSTLSAFTDSGGDRFSTQCASNQLNSVCKNSHCYNRNDYSEESANMQTMSHKNERNWHVVDCATERASLFDADAIQSGIDAINSAGVCKSNSFTQSNDSACVLSGMNSFSHFEVSSVPCADANYAENSVNSSGPYVDSNNCGYFVNSVSSLPNTHRVEQYTEPSLLSSDLNNVGYMVDTLGEHPSAVDSCLNNNTKNNGMRSHGDCDAAVFDYRCFDRFALSPLVGGYSGGPADSDNGCVTTEFARAEHVIQPEHHVAVSCCRTTDIHHPTYEQSPAESNLTSSYSVSCGRQYMNGLGNGVCPDTFSVQHPSVCLWPSRSSAIDPKSLEIFDSGKRNTADFSLTVTPSSTSALRQSHYSSDNGGGGTVVSSPPAICLNTSTTTAGKQSNSVLDRRAPGCEKKLLLSMADYDEKRALAARLRRLPIESKPRTPTDVWSGYGFSRSSPYVLSERLARISQVKAVQECDSSTGHEPTNYDRTNDVLSQSNVFDFMPASLGSLNQSSNNLVAILEKIDGLKQYADVFADAAVDVTSFVLLSETDLKWLGVDNASARQRLLSLAHMLTPTQCSLSAASSADGIINNTSCI